MAIGGGRAGGAAAPVAVIAAQVAAQVDVQPGSAAVTSDVPSDAELGSRLAELARLRAMVDAALVEQVATFDARAAARYDGQTSTLAWLRSRLRLGGQAALLLQVARQLDGLPLLAKALAGGEVSIEHAAEIARLAGQVGASVLVDYEPALVELAQRAPVTRLRQACQHLRGLLDADGAEVDVAGQQQRRYLSAARTVGGMVHLQGLFDPASGDVVLAALQAAMPVPAEYEPRTPPQRRADALVDVCAGWLAAGVAPTAGGVRPQVQVTVSLRSLQTSTSTSTSTGTSASPGPSAAGSVFGELVGDVPQLADGTHVPVSLARRLACDAGVIPMVLGSESEVLDIGRQSRVVPVGLRRLLNLRDGGCRFAGCDRPAGWCDAHHLRHWADGGSTDPANCVLLCGFHHTLVHQGWRIHGDPYGTLCFERPDGTRLDLTSTPRAP